MKIKTKILSVLVLVFQLIALAPVYRLIPVVSANSQKAPLMVSAYYSPLPGQRFYMRGNYEADKILNGRGTNGADGTPVYIGMLAAPKSYPFGTRVKIPGLGVGEVHDRGGAILAKKNYDRIDVWMGHGEEGLARALNWGMRLVDGEVDTSGSQLVAGLSFDWVSSTLPSSTLNRLLAKTTVSTSVATQPISENSPQTSIRDLQDVLRLFGYYHGAVDGIYDEDTKQAVLTFQLSEGVVSTKESQGAGNFGPKTQSKLAEVIDRFNSDVKKEQSRLKDNLEALTVGIGKDEQGDQVFDLQKMLWELGYYYGPFSGQYDTMTIDSVFRFQKDYGVIKDNTDQGAGYFGQKTHSALVAAVNKKTKVIAEGPKEMQSWVPSAQSLPELTQLQLELEAVDHSPKLAFGILNNELFKIDIASNQKGDEVAKLQNSLIKEGLLDQGLNTGYFGNQTKKALISFQLKHGIIADVNDQGAGRVGPGTRSVLNRL